VKIENWKLSDIKPYKHNAKLHNVEWIANSIKNFKPDQPIVVDGDGVIIKGHGRLKAAKYLGMIEFPVVVRTDLTPEEVRLARIADNRSGEGGWDADMLSFELDDINIDEIDFDLKDIGIDQKWFDDLKIDIDNANVDVGGGREEIDEIYAVYIQCDSEAEQLELLTRFEKEGLQCRALIS